MMVRLHMGLLIAVMLALPVQAATPTKESIERLMTLSQTDKLFNGIKPQIDGMMKAMMEQVTKGAKLSPDEQKVIDKYREKVAEIVTAEVASGKTKSLVVQIYAANFSQEEVDGIIAFYETPAGQSMVRKMPAVMQSMMAEMPKIMGPMMEKLKKASEEMSAELQAQRKQKSPN